MVVFDLSCFPCCGGSSSSRSSSSSLFDCCAQGDCQYEWDGASWNLITDTCIIIDCDGDQIGDCECSPPAGDGGFVGEIRLGTCEPT